MCCSGVTGGSVAAEGSSFTRPLWAPPSIAPDTVQGVPVMIWILVVPWAAWAAVRALGLERGWVPVCALAFTPYAALTSPVPLLVALGTGRWVAAVVAG